MLLDEPSTGLDSDNTENVVKALRNLADTGNLVVCTIHQPSSEILEYFDQVIIMHKGLRVFDGPFEELRPFFSERGIDIPENCNSIEYLLNLINLDRNSCKILEEQVDPKFKEFFSEEILDRMEQIIQQENSDKIIEELSRRELVRAKTIEDERNSGQMLPELENKNSQGKIARKLSNIGLVRSLSNDQNFLDNLLHDNRSKTHSFFRSLTLLAKRENVCFYRKKGNWIGKVIVTIITAVLFLILFRNLGYTEKETQNRSGALYNCMMTFGMTAISIMLLTFNDNVDITIKEVEQG